MAEGRFIAYHRVSTAQQGRSGLGPMLFTLRGKSG
jgi:hypothetical protein